MYKYSIGDLARAAATKVQTIRYYEETGLMPEPVRTAGNQRRYDETALNRLSFIRHSRQLGFSLDSIKSLLHLTDNPDQSCQQANQIAVEQLVEVESRIARLNDLRQELVRISRSCKGGTMADCKVIETLSEHSLCDCS